MKNLLNLKPTQDLHGRLKYSTQFVSIEDIKNKDILDIGCGFGWFELFALDKGVTHITGMEISERDLENAKAGIKDKRAHFVVGTGLKIPFNDSFFDTIVSWEVLEHIPKNTEQKFFEECFRVLKPGGVLYLSTQFRNLFSTTLDPAWWLIGHRHYSTNSLKRFAENCGFYVNLLETHGGWWEIFHILNMYISKWILRRSSIFGSSINKKRDLEFYKTPGKTNIFLKATKN